jgi:hypothetical protein
LFTAGRQLATFPVEADSMAKRGRLWGPPRSTIWEKLPPTNTCRVLDISA